MTDSMKHWRHIGAALILAIPMLTLSGPAQAETINANWCATRPNDDSIFFCGPVDPGAQVYSATRTISSVEVYPQYGGSSKYTLRIQVKKTDGTVVASASGYSQIGFAAQSVGNVKYSARAYCQNVGTASNAFECGAF